MVEQTRTKQLRGVFRLPLLYWQMSRPLQLVAVSLVYLMGISLASLSGQIDVHQILVGFFALIPIAISIHMVNEYADVETDALTERTLYSGGSGALPGSGYPAVIALYGAWIALLLGASIALGAFLSGLLNGQMLFLLFSGAIFGWMYSVRPLKLAWRGWGELDNSLLGALLLPLYGYTVASGSLTLEAAIFFLPFTGLAFLNLLATTWADREADGRVGKRTLAVQWRPEKLRRLYIAVAVGSYLLMLLLGLIAPILYLGLLAIPFSIWGFRNYTLKRDPTPSVSAMSLYMLIQLGVWLWLL